MLSLWQPTLTGKHLLLRPLAQEDFEELFAAASDPLIWEMHPEADRYTRPKFTLYFRTGIESQGALVVIHRESGRIIGCSRYTAHDPAGSSVEIGYTFLSREFWGGQANQEMKELMLAHAFKHVERALFFVGSDNLRSRRAMEKIGGRLIDIKESSCTRLDGIKVASVIYELRRP